MGRTGRALGPAVVTAVAGPVLLAIALAAGPSGAVAASEPAPRPPAPSTTSTTGRSLPPPDPVDPPLAEPEPAPVDPSNPRPGEGTLRPGDDGEPVLELQRRLSDLGYWLGEPDGHYGRLTEQAVLAFQKGEGLARDGLAGPATRAALGTASRLRPRSTGDGIELDLTRQLLLVVRDGQVSHAINTSTGTPATPTPTGEFRVERAIDGVRHAPLGTLYRPRYFHEGIAIHGSPSIPGVAASHGCARVSNAAMDLIWSAGLAPIGAPVRVYQ